jgi:hypothetical protein
MSVTQRLLGHTGTALAATALAGLIARGRWRLWYSFAILVAVVSVHDSLVALWPETFYRGDIFRAKEILLILIRLAMVVELTVRVFRRFPGALATARRLLALILASTVVAVVALPIRRSLQEGFVGDLMPRVLNGTIWLFAGLAILILWYRLPVHWFQKAILLSYVPYLLVFTVAMNALGEMGWERGAWANTAGQIAYWFLLLYWNYTAWRRPPPDAPPPPLEDDLA